MALGKGGPIGKPWLLECDQDRAQGDSERDTDEDQDGECGDATDAAIACGDALGVRCWLTWADMAGLEDAGPHWYLAMGLGLVVSEGSALGRPLVRYFPWVLVCLPGPSVSSPWQALAWIAGVCAGSPWQRQPHRRCISGRTMRRRSQPPILLLQNCHRCCPAATVG